MPSPSRLRRRAAAAGLISMIGATTIGLAAAAIALQQPSASAPSLFGTVAYVDERFQGPQTVPGKVQLAYFDVGGPNVSYHSYDWKNHGSCDLNPCDGQYKNVFRKDDGASTSYTKPPNGGWPGDRFMGNDSQVPIDLMYWGWNAIGNWVRASVLVKEAGNYSASFFGTANSGGQIALTVDDYAKTGQETTVLAKVPPTGGYHKWALFPDVATVPFANPGLAVLTVNITGIDDLDEEGMQFGNVLYLDFQKQAS